MKRRWIHAVALATFALGAGGCLAEPDVVLVPSTDAPETRPTGGGAATGEDTAAPSGTEPAPAADAPAPAPAPAPDASGKGGKGGKGKGKDD